MSTELLVEVVCKACGHPGKIVLDLGAFWASCQAEGITEQEGAEAFVASLQELDCPARIARAN